MKSPAPAIHARPRPWRGFTLIEALVTLVIMLILAAIAFPIVQNQIARGRRAQAITALMALQQAEERWRGQHAAYASLTELGFAASTPDKRFELSVQDHGSADYTLVAREVVSGGADAHCIVLKLISNGGQTVQASGPDDAASNEEATNRRCWNQ